MRFVLDTNIFISAFMMSVSTPAQAMNTAARKGKLIFTTSTFGELTTVLHRQKFDRYAPGQLREEFIAAILKSAEFTSVTRPIRACRDPNDDKFLEAAVHGDATHLITGDDDLLALHPFMKVEILMPGDFLKMAL